MFSPFFTDNICQLTRLWVGGIARRDATTLSDVLEGLAGAVHWKRVVSTIALLDHILLVARLHARLKTIMSKW